MDRFCWVLVLVLLGNVSAAPHYSVHHSAASFDQALAGCSPGGLASLATAQEVSAVLGLVSRAAAGRGELTVWVGLRKVKNRCVVPALPLRGFSWTEDGGEDSEPIRWAEEPQETCTTLRCAALWAALDGAAVTRWGLIPVSCRNRYSSVCTLRDQDPAGTPGPEPGPAAPEPATPGPEPAAPEPAPAAPEPAAPEPAPAAPEPEPAAPEPAPAAPEPEPATPYPRPATQKPKPAEPGLPTPGPETDLKSDTGSVEQGPGPGPGPGPVPGPVSDSCEQPYVPESRFITVDRDNASWVQVDCYSVQLEVHCSGRPATWRLADGSPANFSTICRPCGSGFRKDASGRCEDIDECDGGAACRRGCLNTVGSFSCFCTDDTGKRHAEDSPECAAAGAGLDRVLVPVLAGLAALLLLLGVAAVAVKCCRMRRKKRRDMKAEMAMKSSEGNAFQTANEKAAT